ncbi:uncharacterized protein LOC110849250 [Folsomia candida]|nr:uncharacterized protein LOC110849250 [Folsomia candida]
MSSFTTPNSFNANTQSFTQPQEQEQPDQWNNDGGYYATPTYYRNNRQTVPQNQQYQQQYPINAFEDTQEQQHPQYRYHQQQQYRQNRNPSYYGTGEPQRNPPFSHEDDSSPPFNMPMMAPIRRMYHVYEDNVRGFAKRFRNMVYAPMRMMG